MTADKYPWMQFYPGEWISDPALSKCSPCTRGIWIDLLCAMHLDDRCGEVSGTIESMARMARCSIAEMTQAAAELGDTKTADVTFCNSVVTVINRRMKRAFIERGNGRVRVMKHRMKRACNGTEVRSQKSESESDRKERTPLSPIRDPSNSGAAIKAYMEMVKRVYGKTITNTNAILGSLSGLIGQDISSERIAALCLRDDIIRAHFRAVDTPSAFAKDFCDLETKANGKGKGGAVNGPEFDPHKYDHIAVDAFAKEE